MNRAERRRQEKLGVSKQSIMEQYRREAYSEGWHNGMMTEIEITFNMCAYTLGYKTDFTDEQLKQLMHDLYFNIDSYRTGQLTSADYDTICEELADKKLTFHEIMKEIK